MKNLTLILLLFSSLNLFSQFQFAGEIRQEGNTSTTIEVLSSSEGYTYICPQIVRTLSASSIFDLKLEKNTHYTLIFRSGKFDKYVYVDTHGISAYNEFLCYIAEMDAVIYYDQVLSSPYALNMQFSYLDFIQENFPLVRDYGDIQESAELIN